MFHAFKYISYNKDATNSNINAWFCKSDLVENHAFIIFHFFCKSLETSWPMTIFNILDI